MLLQLESALQVDGVLNTYVAIDMISADRSKIIAKRLMALTMLKPRNARLFFLKSARKIMVKALRDFCEC